jgi:hypothetical protein
VSDAKQKYVEQLEAMREKLQKLQAVLDALTGDGTVSDKVHWGHVGDLQHMNEVLDEALRINLRRVK